MRIMIFVCSAAQESPWGARLQLETRDRPWIYLRESVRRDE